MLQTVKNGINSEIVSKRNSEYTARGRVRPYADTLGILANASKATSDAIV